MNRVATLNYTHIREIGAGKGQNSKVYLVNDPQFGGEIVVKEIPLASFGTPVATYFAEAQAMFASNHPNVVQVYYGGTTQTEICIAMPHYPKGSLGDLLASQPLRTSQVLRYGQDVLAGLAHIHLANYVHFDVKPSNVLFTNAGKALVADFGQSRAIGPMGTATVPPLYMSTVPPEAFAGAGLTVAADVYQTGLLLYRCVNGEQDWQAQFVANASALEAKIKAGRFPDRKRFLAHVPRRLRRVIRQAIEVDPKKRFQTANEMGVALGKVDPGLDWTTSTTPSGSRIWSASPPGQAQLEITLLVKNGASYVEAHTIGQKRRAKDRSGIWKAQLTSKEAERHLREVFENLTC